MNSFPEMNGKLNNLDHIDAQIGESASSNFGIQLENMEKV